MRHTALTPHEQRLCHALNDLPQKHQYRYTPLAQRELLSILFAALANNDDDLVGLFFPNGNPESSNWELRTAQGAVDGAEYTAGARGKACGHIFKSGETTYRCKTCGLDDTCVLCSKCFDSSEHSGHTVRLSVSPGNSGCCDCGDHEAWRIPVICAIHSDLQDHMDNTNSDEYLLEETPVSPELAFSIRTTIGRALDYVCDVISCSPEHLRGNKTEAGLVGDELASRLDADIYGGDVETSPIEYSMILWNDEKHTINEVEDQVAKACKKKKSFGAEKARETSDLGRSVLECSQDVKALLHKSKIIEQIKITVTVRSSRDTFREQMCGTIIEWLSDIAGCRVGNDPDLLRQVVCEQFLDPWRRGSAASNAVVGKGGIDDLEKNEPNGLRPTVLHLFPTETEGEPLTLAEEEAIDSDDMVDMDVDVDGMATSTDSDVDMSAADEINDGLEVSEATLAGYPPPPPPPPAPLNFNRRRASDRTPSDSDGGDTLTPRPNSTTNTIHIPHTPGNKYSAKTGRPTGHWLEKPTAYQSLNDSAGEDIRRRVRLDFLLLFDLRLWKKARIGLRDLYISTVVTIPQFKRLLGLRLAAFYPILAQLYLIADREPDHSIINLSLQILTTPSITDEVVEQSNFLTNLISILYTFLTTRQVGHPHEVDANATLAFEAGSLTNRRMYHFFMDLRHLFNSSHVQNKLRQEERYTLQFLDLVKLHQGICPNTRAVGEHVEYETDAWISASLITREINKLCRQFAEPFAWRIGEDDTVISRALQLVAKTAILNSLGLERNRFSQAEIKKATTFKLLDRLELDKDDLNSTKYEVVDFVILNQPISFHHALHYTLSWFIDGAKSMPVEKVRELLTFKDLVFRPDPSKTRTVPIKQSGQALLLALFDFPLRVCAWLAQMKAGIWVRNGLSLRHQSSTYRGVSQRDVAHQRDIFLLQSALVICDPSVILMSIIDRFGMYDWSNGNYSFNAAFEGNQMIEVAEDFLHLLIILLTDRTSLLPAEGKEDPTRLAIKRDIIHVLCFKPLSFSDLCGRLADRYQEMDEFQALMDEMTTYRAPDGLSDFGTFELKEQYLEELDPYIAHYNKNQRDESETAYRNWMAKKLGKEMVEIVYEPHLIPISSGLFKKLSAFTSTNVFVQIILGFLSYSLDSKTVSKTIEAGRVEAFLQVTLHLTLVAILEDSTEEDEMSEESLQSFAHLALTKASRKVAVERSTIASVLLRLLDYDEFSSCFPKINLILRKLKSKRPRVFYQMITSQASSVDRMETESLATTALDDLEAKRKKANDSRAKIMAHFQKEQQNFMSKQGGIDWGVDDFSDADEEVEDPAKGAQKSWKYPSGTCIFCQDAVNETSLFGTFAMIIDSNILRQTNLKDDDFIMEAVQTPENLDHGMDRNRPFGVSGQNIEIVQKLLPNGTVNLTGRQGLGKGFPASHVKRGPVTTGCGHIMHCTCFEHYYQATMRRQLQHQIARAHPERITRKEFVCPLCKAIGNAFLPIIWKSKTEEFPGAIQATDEFDLWLSSGIGPLVSRLGKAVEGEGPEKQVISRCQEAFSIYTSRTFTPGLSQRMEKHLTRGSRETTSLPSLVATADGFFPQAGARQDFIIPQLVPDPELVEIHELFAMYKRLRDTIKLNNLTNLYTYPPLSGGSGEDFTYSDTLAKTLGFSISSAEIAQRGVPLEAHSIWLESLSEQTLTHLRIFSETALSYIAVGGLRKANNNKSIVEYTDMQRRQLHQLFIGHPQIFEQGRPVPDLQLFEPLLLQDIFVFLAESTLFLIPALNLDVHHIMRICYLAEMVKVILGLLNDRQNVLSTLGRLKNSDGSLRPLSRDQHQTTMTAVHQIHTFQFEVAGSRSPWTLQELDECAPLFYRLFRAYALPFLRKSALLLHARYSVDFSKTTLSLTEEPELDRLSKALRLPVMDEILRSVGGPFGLETPATPIIMSLTIGWMRHWRWSQEGRRSQLRKSISLSHPAVLELVGLPKTFDVLIEQVMKRRCPTTGKDMVDPSVCLFCGDIFCSQALCCQQNGKYGGCNNHVEKCGGQIGLFINIRKCCVLYLHQHNGSWSVAPYLDKHGETDPGLRRHHQLFLNQRRYDALLRAAWLNHTIPSTISRKLEADINIGGWESI